MALVSALLAGLEKQVHMCFTQTIKTIPAPWPQQDVYSAFAPWSEVSQYPTAGPPPSSPSQTPLSQSWSPCPLTHCTALGQRHDRYQKEKMALCDIRELMISVLQELACQLETGNK